MIICAVAGLLTIGCDSDEVRPGSDVHHNRPVQVSQTHPLAHAANNPSIDRSNVVVTPQSPSAAPVPAQVAPDQPKPTKPVPVETIPDVPQWRPIDESKVAVAGIRKLESKRLVLYTDVASSPEIDDFPQAFDQAFDLWCQYFGLDANNFPDWRMRASLMEERGRFQAAGLLPSESPNFLNGFTRQYECWLYNQTSPYYRRHLLLHEGVHGFMYTLIGRNAPPWYMEGMAELLATHRWQDGKLELPYYPKRPDDVPKLGRIEIVQKDFTNQQAKQFPSVMEYSGLDYLQVEPYGWSWAATAFLNGNPRRVISTPNSAKPTPTISSNSWKSGRYSSPTIPMLTILIAPHSILVPANHLLTAPLTQRCRPIGAGKTQEFNCKPANRTNLLPAGAIKCPPIPNHGSASRAAFRSATSTASRWEFCWPPCDRRIQSFAPTPANQLHLATLNQAGELARFCSPS
jgi:hypothetical protein